MNLTSFKRSTFIACLSLAANVAMAQTCHYSEIDPAAGKASAGQLTLDFGAGDQTEKPTAWIGPMSIMGPAGKSCTVDPDVSIIERPIYADGKHVLVSTYSGSNRMVYAIDAATCRVLWKSSTFTGPAELGNDRLRLDKQTVKLGPDCIPSHR